MCVSVCWQLGGIVPKGVWKTEHCVQHQVIVFACAVRVCEYCVRVCVCVDVLIPNTGILMYIEHN